MPLSEVERKSMIASARRFFESRGEVAMIANGCPQTSRTRSM